MKKILAIEQLGSSYGSEEMTELATNIALMMETPFGQVDEYEADRNAFAIATTAGFDSSKFADFFKRMIAMGAVSSGEQQSKLSRSHPYLEDRINCINYYIENGL
jgi:predicted Zn-dependent protease